MGMRRGGHFWRSAPRCASETATEGWHAAWRPLRQCDRRQLPSPPDRRSRSRPGAIGWREGVGCARLSLPSPPLPCSPVPPPPPLAGLAQPRGKGAGRPSLPPDAAAPHAGSARQGGRRGAIRDNRLGPGPHPRAEPAGQEPGRAGPDPRPADGERSAGGVAKAACQGRPEPPAFLLLRVRENGVLDAVVSAFAFQARRRAAAPTACFLQRLS